MDALVEEPWRDIRRNHLLDAAGRIFARQGYDATSVSDIAHEAGIGKPTLYRYFASKADLFEASFARTLDDLTARLDVMLLSDASLETRLNRLVSELVPIFRTHLGAAQALNYGAASAGQLMGQRRGEIEARLKAAIDMAQAADQLGSFNTAMVARLMVGMMWSGVGADHLSDDEVVRAVVDLTLRGMTRPALKPHSTPGSGGFLQNPPNFRNEK